MVPGSSSSWESLYYQLLLLKPQEKKTKWASSLSIMTGERFHQEILVFYLFLFGKDTGNNVSGEKLQKNVIRELLLCLLLAYSCLIITVPTTKIFTVRNPVGCYKTPIYFTLWKLERQAPLTQAPHRHPAPFPLWTSWSPIWGYFQPFLK